MEARPTQITEFLNGEKQMMIPLFQRGYEWAKEHWETLWTDLLEQYEKGDGDASPVHFTGAIVTAPARAIPVGISKYLVIDGQQRLTTIAVLLCALRERFPADTPQCRRINRLLKNEDGEGLDEFKLLPTQLDREAFAALVGGAPVEGSRLAEAFSFFSERIAGQDSEGEAIDRDRLLRAIQTRLLVVNIHLGETDDPYLIFESLNAKGAPLTQADLIRNYLLLRLHTQAQQEQYETRWLPMQRLLPPEQLTEFMRHYLMLSGEEVAKSAIYGILKKRLYGVPDTAIPAELQRMQECSELYARICGLRTDADPGIERGLGRLRRWEVGVANPLILRLLEARAKGLLAPDVVAEALSVIESFVVRRHVVRVPTNQLKRIFLTLTKDLPLAGLVDALRETLAAGSAGRRWPKDEEFGRAWREFKAYAQPLDRCRFLLETLEEDHGHRELADYGNATIEHVLPQTLSEEWRVELGPGADALQERLGDTLGNLTLSAYNSELSNDVFSSKRPLFAESHFELNRSIAAAQKWGADEIEGRAAALFERARAIWARPSD